VHQKSNETKIKKKKFREKIYYESHSELSLWDSCNCYTSLLILESILEIPSKLSPFSGQSKSFGWYEIVFLSYSFLTSEREKCQPW
jgi:hypothetical protein